MSSLPKVTIFSTHNNVAVLLLNTCKLNFRPPKKKVKTSIMCKCLDSQSNTIDMLVDTNQAQIQELLLGGAIPSLFFPFLSSPFPPLEVGPLKSS